MGWLGNWLGGGASSGGGSAPVFQALSNATTADLIRDRMVACIEAIVPVRLAGDRFHVHRDETPLDEWGKANAVAALRRFEVLPTGEEDTPGVTNCDIEERHQQFLIRVLYPTNSRTGPLAARDRDTAISRDIDAIERAVGMIARANFSAPYPDAVCTRWVTRRVRAPKGEPCDVLEIETTMRFQRQLSQL